MQAAASHIEAPATIRTDLSAIFVSLELSRSKWLVTSVSPGAGEKMSDHVHRNARLGVQLLISESRHKPADRRTNWESSCLPLSFLRLSQPTFSRRPPIQAQLAAYEIGDDWRPVSRGCCRLGAAQSLPAEHRAAVAAGLEGRRGRFCERR
jgi:hypothetical protein